MTTALQVISVEKWQKLLSESAAVKHGPWKRVEVLPETDSTQDAARRLDSQIGDVIVAGRQLSGRGRLGRAWADTAFEGVAITFVVQASRPERMAIASAVAVADAILASMKITHGWRIRKIDLGVKWPNDIMANGRKIAGVLIEQCDDRAYIGIGVNVRQDSWPEELQGRAASLVELGFDIDRLTVIDLLMQVMGLVARDDDDRICSRFRELDVLTGTTCGFRIGEREIRGKVLRVDPMKGLAVLTENEGEVWLPAATTTVIKE